MANNIGKIAKNTTRPLDEYLKFVQQTFNTNDVSFNDIIKQLENIAKTDSVNYTEAIDLKNRLDLIPILKDLNKYKKFDKLGNFDFSDRGLRQVYKVSDDIIKDINTARNWIRDYRRFSSLLDKVGIQGLHTELLALGKTILGRAVELCPMETGTLRKSGILLDFDTYIIISFTAPYATYVHENMEIAHPIHGGRDCGGRAKFLEIAVQEVFPDRQVWVEHLGTNDVSVKISINPLLIEYSHYGN